MPIFWNKQILEIFDITNFCEIIYKIWCICNIFQKTYSIEHFWFENVFWFENIIMWINRAEKMWSLRSFHRLLQACLCKLGKFCICFKITIHSKNSNKSTTNILDSEYIFCIRRVDNCCISEPLFHFISRLFSSIGNNITELSKIKH